VPRSDIDAADRDRFAKASGASLPSAGTQEFFVEYVDWMCRRNTDELIKKLRRDVPSFGGISKPYALTVKPFVSKVDLFRVFKLVAECRHLIIHNHGRIDARELAHGTGTPELDIQNLYRKSLFDGEMTILPERGVVTDYLEYLADFCFLCYRTISDYCGLTVDFDPYGPDTSPMKGTPEVLKRLHGFGVFRDDPTLPQICEEAYKERHAGVVE
jgi:hypothetical protein